MRSVKYDEKEISIINYGIVAKKTTIIPYYQNSFKKKNVRQKKIIQQSQNIKKSKKIIQL